MEHRTIVMHALAWTAVVPAVGTLYFALFWRWFGWWRRHRALTLAMMIGMLAAAGIAVGLAHERLFAVRADPPWPVQVLGGAILVAVWIVGWVADRQIGLRVRSFTPFFDADGRIELVTTGAYGLVRHPIYAAGIAWQIGVALVTGIAAVAIAALVFATGAVWFTRQEERRLVALLADPAEYERYRARVPALLPWPRP